MSWKLDERFEGKFEPPYIPKVVSDSLLASPGGMAIAEYIPSRVVVPDVPDHRWERVFARILYQGAEGLGIFQKSGIDPELSLRHILAIMRTFSIKHEYKTCAVTFLMQQWWSDVIDGYDKSPGSYTSMVTGDVVLVTRGS